MQIVKKGVTMIYKKCECIWVINMPSMLFPLKKSLMIDTFKESNTLSDLQLRQQNKE